MRSLLIEQFSTINTVDLIIEIINSVIHLVLTMSQFLTPFWLQFRGPFPVSLQLTITKFL